MNSNCDCQPCVCPPACDCQAAGNPCTCGSDCRCAAPTAEAVG